jgi:DNA-binding CsgD family transcriptional regulator
MRGDLDGSRELLTRAYAQASDGGFEQIVVMTGRMLAWFHLFVEGRADDALRVIEELPTDDRSILGTWATHGDITAAARLAKHDLDGAREAFTPGIGSRREFAGPWAGPAVQAWISLAVGEIVEAENQAIAHLERVVRNGAVVAWTDDLDLIAIVRTEVGAFTDAARLFGAAFAGRERFGTISLMRPVIDVDAVIERARTALGPQAFETAHREGASMSLEDAVAFAMRGRGPRQRPPSGWDSLTPTERQVVDLVAEGLTNKQVGEKLFVSSRTVSTHLSHVFAKLGVSSRSELTAEAIKRKAAT